MPNKSTVFGEHNSAEVQPDGTAANVTTKGTTVQSADPSTHPDATLGQKLKGDFQGAVHTATGSAQAAAGAVTRNEKLQQQGLQKMQEEDQRIGAKHGVMPVGSGLREKASGVPSTVDQTQTKPIELASWLRGSNLEVLCFWRGNILRQRHRLDPSISNSQALTFTSEETILLVTLADAQSKMSEKPSVLFVCLGNICRSTMAEGVFRSLVKDSPYKERIGTIDSCGTGAYHAGDDPDDRTMSTLEKYGITDYVHAARKVRASDFATFDYIFAMDRSNLSDLKRLKKPEGAKAKVMLFGEYSDSGKAEVVQDPYYGGQQGFELAYAQCLKYSKNFLKDIFPDVEIEA
ncbi:Low molecular weight phosphotyrosine protein phosphatase [Seiridium cupressi]